MKKCKYCQSEIDSKAKICPNCKKKQGVPGCLIAIIVFIVLIIIVALSYSGSNSESEKTSNSSSKTTKSSEKFTLIEDYKSDESNNYFYYIEGKIQNNRDKDFSYVQVTFTTYDSEGNTIGTCLDNNSGLNANGTWKFKAICSDGVNDIDHYELKEITGW